MAEDGHAIGDITAAGWARGAEKLLAEGNVGGRELLKGDGQPPSTGDVMVNPGMAAVLRVLERKMIRAVDT